MRCIYRYVGISTLGTRPTEPVCEALVWWRSHTGTYASIGNESPNPDQIGESLDEH